MVSLVASLVLACAAHGAAPSAPCTGSASASASHLATRAVRAPAFGRSVEAAVPQVGELKGEVHLRVEALMRGVALIDRDPGSAALSPTFQLRPGFHNGPVALFDLRF